MSVPNAQPKGDLRRSPPHRGAIAAALVAGAIVGGPAAIWWFVQRDLERVTRHTEARSASRLPEPDSMPGGQPTAHAGALDGAFTPPDEKDIPQNQFGEVVRLGRDIFVNTQVKARGFVGNGLNCVNCHLDAGRKPDSAPLWAAYVQYPAYRDKNKKVNSFEDRLAGCFRFSMNGKPPAYDSREMVALVTYSYWLAQGAPTGAEMPGRGYPKLEKAAQPPDVSRGARTFAANCALCHGSDGEGTKVDGAYAFPPLWGPDSYNGGAGMSRVETAAAFIRANMPLGKPNTLSIQEAWDVAQFVNSHPRPADPRKR